MRSSSSATNYVFSVKINGKDAKEYLHGGETYIEGRSKSEFELHFKNNTSTKVKVVFSVDGLSVMDGKTASDKSSGYVVGAWNDIVVPGWRIDSGKVAKFVFRPQGEKNDATYVENLKAEGFDVDAGNQGVIGCMVFKEKYQPPKITYHSHYHYPRSVPNYPMYLNGYGYISGGPSIPMSSGGWYSSNEAPGGFRPASSLSGGFIGLASATSESFKTGGGASNDSWMEAQCFNSDMDAGASLGTGFGDDAGFATSTVEFEAESSPDWVFVIHYDTIINLRKRGVFVEDKKPEAFPGYRDGCYVPKTRH